MASAALHPAPEEAAPLRIERTPCCRPGGSRGGAGTPLLRREEAFPCPIPPGGQRLRGLGRLAGGVAQAALLPVPLPGVQGRAGGQPDLHPSAGRHASFAGAASIGGGLRKARPGQERQVRLRPIGDRRRPASRGGGDLSFPAVRRQAGLVRAPRWSVRTRSSPRIGAWEPWGWISTRPTWTWARSTASGIPWVSGPFRWTWPRRPRPGRRPSCRRSRRTSWTGPGFPASPWWWRSWTFGRRRPPCGRGRPATPGCCRPSPIGSSSSCCSPGRPGMAWR